MDDQDHSSGRVPDLTPAEQAALRYYALVKLVIANPCRCKTCVWIQNYIDDPIQPARTDDR